MKELCGNGLSETSGLQEESVSNWAWSCFRGDCLESHAVSSGKTTPRGQGRKQKANAGAVTGKRTLLRELSRTCWTLHEGENPPPAAGLPKEPRNRGVLAAPRHRG